MDVYPLTVTPKIVTVANTVFGGHPGQYPTVVVGGLFMQGDPLHKDAEKGTFNAPKAKQVVEEVLILAEETGVSLALHNNDPPTSYKIAGIPCIIHSYADFKRAFDIAGSSKLGMEFCLGCWLEGGSKFGDIGAALPEFVAEGRVLIVHFRNVSSPLPVFTETFLDNGYMDMHRLMRILHEANYSGTVILDHTPLFFPDGDYPFAETAYAIGYMRALSQRVRGAYWR